MHLRDPKTGTSICGGDGTSTRFRHFCNCKLCLDMSKARPFEVTQVARALVTVDANGRVTMPVRMTKLAKLLRSFKMDAQAAELEREAKIAAALCTNCNSPIPDPIVLLDVANDRAVYACPTCSEGAARDRWEEDGR